MSAYTPPTKTAASVPAGRLSLALSLVLHIGVGIAFTRLALSSHAPPTSEAIEAAKETEQPYSPETYTRKVEEAKAALQKLSQVAHSLEALATTPPSDRKAIESALKETREAQTQAAKALEKAQSGTPESKNSALAMAQADQAMAFLAQDRLQQELLRPAESPKTAPQQKALDAVKQALERQADAQAALHQAQEALQQAQQTKSASEKIKAEKALQQAQVAQQVAIEAQKPVPMQVAAARSTQIPASPLPEVAATPESQKAEGAETMGDVLEAARTEETKIDKLYQELKKSPESQSVPPAARAREASLSRTLSKGAAHTPARAVNAAEEEIAAIAARAQRLLDQAQGHKGTQASVFVEKMTTLASQDKSGRVADLTGFSVSGAKKGQKTLPGTPPPGQRVGIAPPAISDTTLAEALPGRRLMGEGAGKPRWMFVDSWYIIGPFPNPDRKNLRTRFGPEERVDLDAQFSGLDGRVLTWKFWQTNSPRVVPPNAPEYAVYYLFTELYSDRERDLWFAIGSDDQSNLWLNEQLVWMSSDVLKGWQIGEGLRRVHLKKGRNRLLLRLENGWRGTDTSLLFSLGS